MDKAMGGTGRAVFTSILVGAIIWFVLVPAVHRRGRGLRLRRRARAVLADDPNSFTIRWSTTGASSPRSSGTTHGAPSATCAVTS